MIRIVLATVAPLSSAVEFGLTVAVGRVALVVATAVFAGMVEVAIVGTASLKLLVRTPVAELELWELGEEDKEAEDEGVETAADEPVLPEVEEEGEEELMEEDLLDVVQV